MNDIKERIYFSFQELLDFLDIEGLPSFPNDKGMSQSWFTDMLEDSPFEFAVYTLSEFFTDDLINDIVNALMGIVYNRHAYDFIVYKEIDFGGNEEIEPEEIIKAFQKLINVLNNTLPKYVPMLQQNEWASTCPITPNVDDYVEEVEGNTSSEYSGENESHSGGENRTNDTPQDGGDFSDDEHTSAITSSKDDVEASSSASNTGDFSNKTTRSNTQNIGTLMSRLNEMYINFRSIILNWSNEFNQCFIKEEQLYD